MDNQQGKNLKDIIWLCGFLDGEGSFIALKSHAKALKTMRYQPYIKLAGTHYPTLDEVMYILKANNLPFHVEERKPQNKKWQQSWMVVVSGYKRCKNWLNVISPYLRTKKVDAQNMSTWINSRLSSSPKDAYTEEEIMCISSLRNRRK